MSFALDETTRAAWCIVFQNFELPKDQQFNWEMMKFPDRKP